MAAAAITLGSALVGGFFQYKGMQQQVEAQKKAERLRERQMNLQAMRERRESIRQAVLARSTALATATSQGASAPGSSALGGAYGQIQGERNRQILAINQNQQIGQGIFAANRDYFRGTQTSGFGSAIAGAGQAVGSFLESSFAGKSVGGVKIA